LARKLFELVVAPALATHPKSVTIIPDGSLHLVPFASLRDEKDQYWMKSVQIASAPSATVFHRLRSTHQVVTPKRPFLGIAFSPPQSSDPVVNASRSREASFGDHPLDLKPLPYAQQEVSAAAQVLGTGSVLLTGDRASESSLKAQPLSDFKVIHLAAHGVSDVVEPDRAGLVLAPEGGSEDGFWQAREIRRSHLAADLVTLSACETGIGRLQGEEGIMNLARSFLVAGAKSVVASLWDADDRSTATLMAHFYKHIASGDTVTDSLRKAQVEMLSEFGEDAKPYFWSGFTVIGDGTRKIALQTRATELGTARTSFR
jgi:CHAT domain-containing protein